MKKVFGIILVSVLLFGCNKEENINNEVNMDGYAAITLDTNGGVPYLWECEIKDNDILEYFTDEYVIKDEDKDLDGGPVQNIYYYKGLKEGETVVTCSYKSITNEDEIAKTLEFKVKVNDKLEASVGE